VANGALGLGRLVNGGAANCRTGACFCLDDGKMTSFVGMSSGLESLEPGLRWLVSLRWLALIGQCLLFLAGAFLLHVEFPLGIVIPCLAVTAASNLFVAFRGDKIPPTGCCALLLLLDTLTLTVLLY
jgi:hypothetical protein